MDKPISEVKTIRQLLRNEEMEFVYIENGKSAVKKMEKNRQYVIPAYQRKISWNPHNMQILLKDVSSGPKFLGIVLLSTSNYKTFEIIDGQQRITSILMILECLKKKNRGIEINLCEFVNKSFEEYNSVLSSEFIVTKDDVEKVEESDYLRQFETYKNLWLCVVNFIEQLKEEEMAALEEHLLDSCMCVLLSKVDPDSNESYRLCVDYFIDINNKSEHLNSIEILKAYAFRENYKISTTQWEEIQRNENKLKSTYYPKEVMFLHYFLCCVNLIANYQVKGITEEFKLKNSISIDSKEYIEGMDIELLTVGKRVFYMNMLNDILEFQKFMLLVERDKTMPSADFEEYFVKGTDPDTIIVSFKIICGILRNSDVIPKMLLLKYFLFVLNDKNKQSNKTDLLACINVLAVSFSASKTGTKSSSTFGSIVLKEKWENAVIKLAKSRMDTFIEGLGFAKEMTQNKQVTSTSGEYMARRVIGLLYSYTRKQSGWVFDQNKYKIVMNTQGQFNCEHFFFDENQTYSFIYDSKRIERELPSKLRNKYIAYIGNYFLINGEINKEMGNLIIRDKISIIKKHISNKENNIFLDQYSKKFFEIAEEFFSNSKCPTQDEIDASSTKEEAINLVEDYLNDKYVEEVLFFIKKLYEDMQKWHSLKKHIDFSAVCSKDSSDDNYIIEFISSKGAGSVNRKYMSWPLFRLDASKPQDWKNIISEFNSGEDEISIENTDLERLIELRQEHVENVTKDEILTELVKIDGNVGKCVYCLWDVKNPTSIPEFFSDKGKMLVAMEKSIEDRVTIWQDMSLKDFKKWMKRLRSDFKKIDVRSFESV